MTELKGEGKNSAYDVISSTSSRILLNYLALRVLRAQNHFRAGWFSEPKHFSRAGSKIVYKLLQLFSN